MNGKYIVDPSKYYESKIHGRRRILKAYGIIYILFLLLIFINNDTDTMVSIIVTTAVMAFGIIVGLIAVEVIKYPLNGTVIEFEENSIIRTGDRLLRVRMEFNDIGKIIERNNGLVLIKKGLKYRINFHFNKYRFLNEFGILFIPSNIHEYQNIKRFIYSVTR